MRLVLLGPAGAGKGTQAARLRDRLGIPHVSTGDILRKAVASGSELGEKARSYMEAGKLVPDEVILGVMRDWLCSTEASDGFILDGFPRNVAQAEELTRILDDNPPQIEHVVLVDVPDSEIVTRLASRWSCPACGRIYNVIGGPMPEREGFCGTDGTPLTQRTDDTADVVKRRLTVYRDQTEPLVGFYEQRGLLRRIDGLGSPDEVERRIAKEIS